MRELLASDLSLAATDLLADKKSPVSGTWTAVLGVLFVLAVIFLVVVTIKRRR
ncbi:hypothetical protein V6V47_03770 [Micromonospora sp. CPCC 205539]|uniref:hypothetical protein n=1 Tax=Micromonospora sp. CPCC 205539 TaxID=3122408 RepID=UPI002FF3F47E